MEYMVKKNVYLTEEQIAFLTVLPGTLSEHIRNAVDRYIKYKQKLEVRFSPSSYGRSKTK